MTAGTFVLMVLTICSVSLINAVAQAAAFLYRTKNLKGLPGQKIDAACRSFVLPTVLFSLLGSGMFIAGIQ